MQAAVKRSAIVLFLDECSIRRYGQVKRRSRVTVEEHVVTHSGDLVKRKTTKGWLISFPDHPHVWRANFLPSRLNCSGCDGQFYFNPTEDEAFSKETLMEIADAMFELSKEGS